MFFGFYVVRAYDYWWGYTAAQLELMISDAPLIVYKDNKDGDTHSKKELEELARKWKEKKERDAKAGKTVNLNDFLKGNNNE